MNVETIDRELSIIRKRIFALRNAERVLYSERRKAISGEPPVLRTGDLRYRSRDGHSGVQDYENNMFYRFFNEWVYNDIFIVPVAGGQKFMRCRVERHAYDGYVDLIKIGMCE
ncbi:hypothetical protein VPHK567_0232 [Vibrio phage K567]